MTESLPIKNFKEIFEEYRENIGLDSYLNCGAIHSELRNIFYSRKNSGIKIYVAEGKICKESMRGVGTEHAFILIPPKHIVDSSKPVIFDAALDQFCTENKQKGKHFLAISDKSNIPPVVVTRGTRNRQFDKNIHYVIESKT